MRTIVDAAGKRWEVFELARHGVGARGEGDRLPEATFATVIFRSERGEQLDKELAAGAIETITDAELLILLAKKVDNDEE